MPLTLKQLQTVQADAFADDLDIDIERMQHWTLAEATSYFESGGTTVPGSKTASVESSVPSTPSTADVVSDPSKRFTGKWIVADMDSTLIRKERSVYGMLDDSPCRGPLLEWLGKGGSLCVVTSDDGWRPFEQLWKQIPAALRVRVYMSTSDGAALFRGNAQGTPEEDTQYWTVAQGGIQAEHVDPLMRLAHAMHCSLLQDCLDDRAHRDEYLKLLSAKDATAMTALLAEASQAGSVEAVLPVERLTRPSGVLSRGAMIWRNQAGPMSGWKRDKTFVPVPSKGQEWNFVGSVAATQPGAKYTNCFLMCFPRAVSGKYIERFEGRLAALGCVASAAPNSVCLKSAVANKALPIRWLTGDFPGAPSAELDLARAVAFGDNPTGNDEPLTTFADKGMRFVSVAASGAEELPAALRPCHVGGLEAGTAKVLQRLVAQSGNGAATLGEAVGAICAELRDERV